MGRNHESNKSAFIKHVPRFAFVKNEPRFALIKCELDFFYFRK
jgi:hypothetical protein